MSGRKKLIVICIFFGVILIASYLFFGSRSSQVPKKLNRNEIIARLNTLEFKRELTEEKKKEITDLFAVHQEELRKALDIVNREGDRTEGYLFQPLLFISNLHRDAGDFEGAEQGFLFLIQMTPASSIPPFNLAQLYFRDLKDYKKADMYYEKAAAIDGFQLETVYDEWSQMLRFQLKDEKKAERILIEGVNRYPQETNILAILANLYRDTGQTQKAIERYEELLSRYPDSMVAKNALKELRP